MTKADWLGDDPNAMGELLHAGGVGDARRWRLFACACVRRIWPLLDGPLCTEAIEVAERYADGADGVDALGAALSVVATYRLSVGPASPARKACVYAAFDWAAVPSGQRRHEADGNDGWLVADRASREARDAAVQAAGRDAQTAGKKGGRARRVAKQSESVAQAALLRDVFGPWPLRPVSAIDPSVLAWGGGIVRDLAQSAYNDSQLPSGHLDPARLAVLADALEEAGHADPELLSHLRGPGPHVRGCWAIDLLLGKL